MRQPRRRGRIAFTLIWLVVWAAAILIAIRHFGAAALSGETGPAIVLTIWIALAGLALWRVGSGLAATLAGRTTPPRPPGRRHQWRDGLGRPDDKTNTESRDEH